MSTPLVTINLVVYNGEKYIRQCLYLVLARTYKDIEINILDNASTDRTSDIIKLESGNWKTRPKRVDGEILNLSLIKSEKNLGMWPGQEELLKHSHGKYIVVLSVDVILDENFITEAVRVLEADEKIGAVQGKILKFLLDDNGKIQKTKVIDTLGFQAFKSRRIVNVAHGEEDRGQYNEPHEIFAVEGAVPVFRREALESCRLESQDVPVPKSFPMLSIVPAEIAISVSRNMLNATATSASGRIIDPDFFWYGDDLDIAWRMRLFGWKQVYVPTAIAWHDRKTTKQLAGGNWQEFIKIRKTVPLFKRKLDWRNMTLAIIKNDLAGNFLSDLPYILWRQIKLWCYFLIFETAMILEIFNVAKMVPKMLKRRREIMRKKKATAKEMSKWF